MGVFQRTAVRRICLYRYREMLRRTSRDEAPAKDKTSHSESATGVPPATWETETVGESGCWSKGGHSEEPTLDSRRRISPLD